MFKKLSNYFNNLYNLGKYLNNSIETLKQLLKQINQILKHVSNYWTKYLNNLSYLTKLNNHLNT